MAHRKLRTYEITYKEHLTINHERQIPITKISTLLCRGRENLVRRCFQNSIYRHNKTLEKAYFSKRSKSKMYNLFSVRAEIVSIRLIHEF